MPIKPLMVGPLKINFVLNTALFEEMWINTFVFFSLGKPKKKFFS